MKEVKCRMHGLGADDPGRKIDWGLTSEDYAKYRPGPPETFYDKLKVLGISLSQLRRIVPVNFTILHRIDAHIFEQS